MAQCVKDMTSQEICINNHEGMFLVVAGPGVGKTYTIVKRIQAMVEKEIDPERILCLTFSDTAAREMKSRVGDNVNVNVYTYHGFCFNIMEEFAEYFNSYVPKVITDSHKRTLINECIDEINPVAYNNEKNNPYQFADNIIDGIEEIKKNRITKREDFFRNLENNPEWLPRLKTLEKEQETDAKQYRARDIKSLTERIEKMKELWSFYELYNSKTRELGYIDFYDMINIVLANLENPESPLLELICERYDYVIVDEYQDTNTAQNDIVFNLAKHINNVFVVGDDDQIIYTFQGAHLDTIEKFLHNFKDKVNVLCFDKNYRSTQNILDLACSFAELQDNGFYRYMLTKSKLSPQEKKDYQETPAPKLRFISKCKITDDNGNLLTKKLTAANEDVIPLNKPVDFIEFTKSDDERDYIVQKIIELKNNGIEKLSEIAILTRKNDDLKEYATYLKANGISTEITGGKNIFEISSVNVLVTYLQFLTNPENYSDKLLSFLLLKPFHIDPRDYKTLCDFQSHNKTLLDNIKKMIGNAFEKDKLENFVKTYEYLQDYIESENYKNALIEIANKTGILQHYFNDDINKLENIKGFKKLLNEADSYFEIHKNQGNSFKFFVDYLTNLIESGTKVRLDKEDKPMNAVQLSTYHGAKGREFEYVFMPGLTRGRWESSNSSYKDIIPATSAEGESYEDAIAKYDQAKFLDSIKLLYVGMTRAKHSLTLSYTKTNDTVYGRLSWFIQQLLDDEKLNNIFNRKYNVELSDDYVLPKYEYDYSEEFKDFMVSKLPNKFSVSGLNAYRSCPKRYFYDYILELNSPSSNSDDASFGTAMHTAFEYAINEVMDKKKYPSADEAYKAFCAKLDTLVCDYPENLKQSAKEHIFSPDGYYEKFKALVNENEIGEHTIQAEYQLSCETEIEGKKTILNGYIDRLDKDKNGNYSIYDYKSKLHCSSISPSDNYFYQMAFYKYVFELQHPEHKVTNATFLFPLEADKNHAINLINKFDEPAKNSDKTLYSTKIEELINCIKGIYDLQFDVPAKPNCAYCSHKQFCQTKTV